MTKIQPEIHVAINLRPNGFARSIHDFVDPDDPQGRTYRQVNAAKVHNIPIGALVEYEHTGIRAFVVLQERDCDQTPHYYLSVKDTDVGKTAVQCGAWKEGFLAPGWFGGCPEYSLTVIKAPKQ